MHACPALNITGLIARKISSSGHLVSVNMLRVQVDGGFEPNSFWTIGYVLIKECL